MGIVGVGRVEYKIITESTVVSNLRELLRLLGIMIGGLEEKVLYWDIKTREKEVMYRLVLTSLLLWSQVIVIGLSTGGFQAQQTDPLYPDISVHLPLVDCMDLRLQD
jgi:hypothetical protein